MNLEESLAKEAEIKQRLLAAIDNGHQLDPKAAGKVDGCMLGNWLHGEGEQKFRFVKSFGPCVAAHDALHAEVEKVVRQINLGEYDQAKAMIANGGSCTRAFVGMVAAVRQLKAELKL
ncbi:CZB domain-containing protein [Noviherbaspirillum aridicola]|uniref:Chemoreceptor zinc-binding domain-containing protein n=1 Tax=Noviherbaspirillum aridicola TaxID=2849687 RepID=A0ABQ4PYX9_9BURK|nr:CZB domain-containing protein [Noviherbaspirillum aridicola]GIZ50064.1 hypothetical protein NCCP691_00780 [Noviherbaspirillum aridicola]